MEIGYLIAILITATGLLAGYLIGLTVPKEIKQSKKYLILLQSALFTIIIGLIIYEYKTTFHFIWVGAVLMLVYYLFNEKLNSNTYWLIGTYAFYGILAYVSYDYFLPLAGTQFIYGLTTGSLNLKKWKILIPSGIIYILIAGLLILLI